MNIKEIYNFTNSSKFNYAGYLLDKILTFRSSTNLTPIDMQEFDRKIDRLLYKLYDLTKEEIKIVEGE